MENKCRKFYNGNWKIIQTELRRNEILGKNETSNKIKEILSEREKTKETMKNLD